MDEYCWTAQDTAFPYSYESLVVIRFELSSLLMRIGQITWLKYWESTLPEKELLRYDGELEKVSLVCGLLGRETLLSSMPEAMRVLISQGTKNKRRYRTRFLEELLGEVPILQIEDLCDAHIFCLDKPSISGRFLRADASLSSADIASHCRKQYPDIDVPDEFMDNSGRAIFWDSSKLKEIGFDHVCDVKMILENSINCGLRLGEYSFQQPIKSHPLGYFLLLITTCNARYSGMHG